MIRIRWPVALATLFLIVFGWYLVYTQLLQDGLRENQALMSEVFAIAQELIQDTSRSERLVGGRLQDVPLFDLQEVMIRSGIPMIIISPAESVVSVENLPFEADILTWAIRRSSQTSGGFRGFRPAGSRSRHSSDSWSSGTSGVLSRTRPGRPWPGSWRTSSARLSPPSRDGWNSWVFRMMKDPRG